jgi:potassium-dependent mechanosensitive channel
LQSFGESSLNFDLRLWTDLYTDAETKSRVSITIANALQQAGIALPFVERDLRLKSIDERLE